MNDPKYMCTVNGLWHISGNYMVPSNEPIMTLRGKDVTSIVAITAYIKALLECDRTETVMSHLDSSIERLYEIYKYQQSLNPGVGCSQEYHSESNKWLNEAEELLNYLNVPINNK